MSTTIPSSDVITTQIEGHVATVWLDRPDKLNALGPQAWVEFPAIVTALGSHPDVRVLVVAGKGKAFTAGLDLAHFGAEIMTQTMGGGEGSEAARRRALQQRIKEMQHTFTSLAECPLPVIAAVHGYCIGAGIDLITACDIRLASSDAVFSVRETKIAMVADVGTTQRLPRVIAPGHAAEMIYTGRDFTASEVHAMGLVNHVYDDRDQLLKAAAELAAEIAANSPLAVQGAKAVLTAQEAMSVTEALDYVSLWNAAYFYSDDLGEAMASFVEKRPPEFRGE